MAICAFIIFHPVLLIFSILWAGLRNSCLVYWCLRCFTRLVCELVWLEVSRLILLVYIEETSFLVASQHGMSACLYVIIYLTFCDSIHDKTQPDLVKPNVWYRSVVWKDQLLEMPVEYFQGWIVAATHCLEGKVYRFIDSKWPGRRSYFVRQSADRREPKIEHTRVCLPDFSLSDLRST